MKGLTGLFLAMAVSAFSPGCAQSKQPSIGRDEVVLLVSVDSTVSAVGYGWVHNCRVEKVIKGQARDTTITLTVLAGDPLKESILAGASKGAGKLEMGFLRHGGAEEYRLAPISGFVDSDSTSWEITFIKQPGQGDGG